MLTGELPLVFQLAAALSPEVLKAGPADAVRSRPPGVADVQTRFISSVSPQHPCQDADLLRVNVGVCLVRRYPDTFGSAISTHMSSSRPRGPLDVWPRLLELVDGSDVGVHTLFFF